MAALLVQHIRLLQAGHHCGKKKGSTVARLPLLAKSRNYFLPKRLRNFSTRPPMLSTDF